MESISPGVMLLDLLLLLILHSENLFSENLLLRLFIKIFLIKVCTNRSSSLFLPALSTTYAAIASHPRLSTLPSLLHLIDST